MPRTSGVRPAISSSKNEDTQQTTDHTGNAGASRAPRSHGNQDATSVNAAQSPHDEAEEPRPTSSSSQENAASTSRRPSSATNANVNKRSDAGPPGEKSSRGRVGEDSSGRRQFSARAKLKAAGVAAIVAANAGNNNKSSMCNLL